MRRIIGECRPRWVLAENVPALRTRGADIVLADLEALGYSAWPVVVGAWAVGAPHRRDRVWIVARRVSDADDATGAAELVPERSVAEATELGGSSGVADADAQGRGQRHASTLADELGLDRGRGHAWPAGPGQEQHEWEAPRLVSFARSVGGTVDGLPARLGRLARRHNRESLRAYGNAVVPAVVEAIGRWIVNADTIARKGDT